MSKSILFAILLLTVNLNGIVQETASFKGFVYGSAPECEYDNWISHLSEGIADEDYNVYAPYDPQTTGFGDFYLASEEELDEWVDVIDRFSSQDYLFAESLLNLYEIPYQIVEFTDTDTDRTYYILREILNPEYYDDNGTPDYEADDEIGGFDYGWGLYVYDPAALNPIIITAPHPNDDYTTSTISAKCLQDWNASFLLINGAGREVKWTEVGNYSNSKSLSDPSRNEDHPLTRAYQRFCDRIRTEFERREFSPQIHSYDWNRHANHSSCQISAGYNRSCPNLPIRDLSDLKIDIINNSEFLMIPENSLGNNEAVYINDYYAVNYNLYEFTFSNDDTTVVVNNSIDLPGYSGNKQMLYSQYAWNHYDVFEPFFHLEMDELPNCYDQTEEYWYWFFGYDIENEQFDMDHLFDFTILYYSGWIDAMTETLPLVLELDDDLVPTVPQDFQVIDVEFDQITLNWQPISAFDFKTYEIFYSPQIIDHLNSNVLDRESKAILASQLCPAITVEDLNGNHQYFFRIRALDYNGNYSPISWDINAYTGPADITGVYAVGRDEEAVLYWTAIEQIRNRGFNVYRRTNEGDFIQIASYETDPSLSGSPEEYLDYIYYDDSVFNNGEYSYKISAVNSQGMEFVFDQQAVCAPSAIYSLIISEQAASLADTSYFSANYFATDGYDQFYDLIEADTLGINYIYSAFYEDFWMDEMYFSQETKYFFDPELTYKSWELAVATNLINEALTISVSENFDRDGEKLYLLDDQNDELFDLRQESLEYVPVSTDTVYFTLYWGNLKPIIYIVNQPNWIYQTGEVMEINWISQFSSLIHSVDLSLQTDSDSIFIADQIINTANSFSWIIPNNMEIQNARIVINVETINDEYLTFMSSQRVGIVPYLTGVSREIGWSTVASTWVDEIWQASVIFDETAELYTFSDPDLYLYTDYFSYGNGYWLYTENDFQFLTDSNIQQSHCNLELYPGWNLIPNPHLATHKVNGFRFINNDDEVNFRQAIQEEWISRSIYVYDSDHYAVADSINAGEAFYIYSYVPDSIYFSMVFIPYHSSFDFSEVYDWKLPVYFQQLSIDRDEIILGTSYLTSDDYEVLYDLPEPPAKPFAESISCYFLKNDPQFYHDKLNSEFKYPLFSQQPQEVSWEFSIDVNVMQTIQIWADFSEFPDDYHVRLNFEGSDQEILDGEICYIEPSGIGTLTGDIIIQNQLWVNAKENIVVADKFINYPNPFNPETSFSFYLNKDSKVELSIYNIRGQKVTRLVNGLLPRGKHNISWAGADNYNRQVASGIYIARLNAGGETKTRKLLLVK